MGSCHHARSRTVMLELHGDGAIAQRTYCGTVDEQGVAGKCGHIFTGGRDQLMRVEDGRVRVRVGHRAYEVTIREIHEREIQ